MKKGREGGVREKTRGLGMKRKGREWKRRGEIEIHEEEGGSDKRHWRSVKKKRERGEGRRGEEKGKMVGNGEKGRRMKKKNGWRELEQEKRELMIRGISRL